MDIPVDGTAAPGFEHVRAEVASVLAEQDGAGAAVAVWHDGAWVVDLWGGYADASRTRPWTEDTDDDAPAAAWRDWDGVCAALARQRPAWEPGTAHGECALFFGHLVGEVVRRVDGRSLVTFLREEVCAPLGLDFHIGLPRASTTGRPTSPASGAGSARR